MSRSLFVHHVNGIKVKIDAHEYMGEPKQAELFRELMRMINRRHITTLTQLNDELKKKGLNNA